MLNLVLCGSNEELKTSISDLILDQRNVETGLVCGRVLRLAVMPALYNTRLSDKEVMDKILHCISLDNPVHAFLFIIPVGPLTDDDKGEIEKIQRTFSSRFCDHSIVLFTNKNLNEDAAVNIVKQSSEMEELLKLFGDRYMILEKEEKRRRKQVSELLDRVTNMNKIYSLPMFIEAQKDGAKRPLEEKLSEMKKRVNELEPKQWETCELYIGRLLTFLHLDFSSVLNIQSDTELINYCVIFRFENITGWENRKWEECNRKHHSRKKRI